MGKNWNALQGIDKYLQDTADIQSDKDTFNESAVNASIMFADLVGSTAFKQNRDVESIDGLARTFLHNKTVAAAIRRNHGTVVKFLGDGVMGLFRDEAHRGNAMSAAVMAIEMMDAVSKSPKRPQETGDPLETKIGLNSGPVWMFTFEAGEQQSTGAEALSYDPQGPTVDLAARLCDMAGPLQILCTNDMYQAAERVPDSAIATDATPRFVKSFRDKIKLVSVAPAGQELAPVRLSGHPRTPSKEIAKWLREAADHLKAGKIDDAIAKYKNALVSDPGCFEANFRLAELYIRQGNGTGGEALFRQATKRLCDAKQVRPEASRVWLLLSWAELKLFERVSEEDHTQKQLDKAIKYVKEAITISTEQMDLDAIIQAKTHLAACWHAQAQLTPGSAAENLVEARSLLYDVERVYKWNLRRQESDHLAMDVRVRLAQGEADYDTLDAQLNRAAEIDENNPLVDEVRGQLKRKRGQLSPITTIGMSLGRT